MKDSTAKLILDRLNEKTNIDYCSLNETEVINIILKADKENEMELLGFSTWKDNIEKEKREKKLIAIKAYLVDNLATSETVYGEEIETIVSQLNSDGVLSYYYETVASTVNGCYDSYKIINYWSEHLKKSVMIDQDAPDSFEDIDEMADQLIEWEEECQKIDESTKPQGFIIDPTKPLAEELARITLELTAQPFNEPMDGDATADLADDFLKALDNLMGNA